MRYAVRQIHDRRLVVFAEAGPLLKDENDVSLPASLSRPPLNTMPG